MQFSTALGLFLTGVLFLFGKSAGLSLDDLKECYNSSVICTKDTLLPMTMPTFIALLRKAENDPRNQNTNSRSLSIALLQRFRLDGIKRRHDVEITPSVRPFGTDTDEYQLYNYLFTTLLPNSLVPFYNDTFTRIERCTLHWMLSTSIDWYHYGDIDCSNLSKDRTSSNWRVPRAAGLEPLSVEEDAELFDPRTGPGVHSKGNFMHVPSLLNNDQEKSECPIENGLVYHKSGTVNPGMVLAGIAAGLNRQSASLHYLMQAGNIRRTRPSLKPAQNYPTYRKGFVQGASPNDGQIDNTWALTFSGILGELVLRKGALFMQSNPYYVGYEGVWNDTTAQKYYFQQTPNEGISNGKIRGALDGKIMANNVLTWTSQGSSDIKLSQLFDMYYSNNGVFNPQLKSCNRRTNYNSASSTSDMTMQTYNLATHLKSYVNPVQLDDDALHQAVTGAVSAMDSGVNSLSDQCNIDPPNTLKPLPTADLHIVIDMSWNFFDISRILIQIGESLMMNPFSNITLIRGNDGSVMLDPAPYFRYTELIQNFTYTNYISGTTAGNFNMVRTVTSLRQMCYRKLDWDRVQNNSPGGPPRIALFIVTSTATVSDDDQQQIRYQDFYKRCPDFKFLYFVDGSKDRFKFFADDFNKDVVQYTQGQLSMSIQPLMDRIGQIPWRLINPSCGQNWNNTNLSQTLTMNVFLAQGEIKYFKLSSNYFYKGAQGKITVSSDRNTINYCISSYNPNPGNSTNTQAGSGDTCIQLLPGTSRDIQVNQDRCSSSSYGRDCPPIYISLSNPSATTTTGSVIAYTDNGVRFVDSAKAMIIHQGLTCYSGVSVVQSSTFFIVLLLCVKFLV